MSPVVSIQPKIPTLIKVDDHYVNLDQWMAAINKKCKKRKKRRSKKLNLNAKEQKGLMDLKDLLAPSSTNSISSWSTDISTDINDIDTFWPVLI